MPTRTFCDLCDKQIPDDDPIYGIVISSNRRIDHSSGWNGNRINIENVWTDAEIHHSLLCLACIKAIHLRIGGLKANG